MKVDMTMMNEENKCSKNVKKEDNVITKLWVSVKMEPAGRGLTGLAGYSGCQACSSMGLASGGVWCYANSETVLGKYEEIEGPRRPLGRHQRHSVRLLSSLRRWRDQIARQRREHDRWAVKRSSAWKI